MASLVTYAKQAWQDAKTAITAARLNHMEDGINDCATQINKLGDSVSRSTSITFKSSEIFEPVACAKLIVEEMRSRGVEVATGYVFMTGQRAFVANRYTNDQSASILIFDPWNDVHAVGEIDGVWSYKKL